MIYRSYGITLWYPTYVDDLTTKKDADDLQKFCNKTTNFSPTDKVISYCGCSSSVFQDTVISHQQLEKWRINNVLFTNVTFLNVTFDYVLFNSTEFRECKFLNSTFTRLFFNATNFNDVQFESVNIVPTSLCLFSNKSEGAVTLENVTINGRMAESRHFNISELWTFLEPEVNSTCSENQYADIMCRSDDFRVYRDSFIVSGSAIPGVLVSATAVYFLRRNYWLGKGLLPSTYLL